MVRAAGQKNGPDGLWLIEGFPIFEQAYAYTLGYQRYQMERLLPVVCDALRCYDRGEYARPTQYYIVEGIPPIPGQIQPPSPADVCPWPPIAEIPALPSTMFDFH